VPSPRSDEASSELAAAARLHGEPLSRLNNLVRWYVRTSILFLVGGASLPILRLAAGGVSPAAIVPFLLGGVLMFVGGLSLKFLPSSLGANPRVHSLRLALYSYWLMAFGVLFWAAAFLPAAAVFVPSRWIRAAGSLSLVVGGGLLLYNVGHSMRRRV